MPTVRPRRAPRRGFTLLELSLAAAIVAMIGLTLYASMAIGFRARGSAYNQVRAMREAAIVLDVVQQDLQSIPPPGGTLSGTFIGYAMGTSGAEADSLEFHTIGRDADAPETPVGEGIRRIELLLRTDVDPPVLVRRVQRNLLAPTEEEPPEEILARGVRAFSVRYYDGYGWAEEWDSTLQDDALPQAVELTIELDQPRPNDPEKRYRVTQVIPLPCAPPLDTGTEAIGG
jgi:type II secretion system protein J